MTRETTSPLEIVPGVYDVLSALACKQSGFHTQFLSGAAVHAAALGWQDIGVLTATELADTTARICERIDCSLIVDADSGYGGTHNLRRLVKMLERAGAAIIQIEDQLSIKPPHLLHDRPVVQTAEMVDRIHAAVDSRLSERTLISARTDALPALGLDDALDRAAAFAEAGADLLFVQSLKSPEDADRVSAAALGRPLVIHLPDQPSTSGFNLETLCRQGFVYGLLPSLLINASAEALSRSLRSIGSGHEGSGLKDWLAG